METKLIDQMQAMIARASQPMDAMGATKAKASIAVGENHDVSFRNVLNEVNETQMEAGKLKEAFAMGDPNVSLAQVQLASLKATVATTATTQIRNKFVKAYQEIMNMPV